MDSISGIHDNHNNWKMQFILLIKCFIQLAMADWWSQSEKMLARQLKTPQLYRRRKKKQWTLGTMKHFNCKWRKMSCGLGARVYVCSRSYIGRCILFKLSMLILKSHRNTFAVTAVALAHWSWKRNVNVCISMLAFCSVISSWSRSQKKFQIE